MQFGWEQVPELPQGALPGDRGDTEEVQRLVAERLDGPDLDIGVLVDERHRPAGVVEVVMGVDEPEDRQVAVAPQFGDRLGRCAGCTAGVDGDDAGLTDHEGKRRHAVAGSDEHAVGQLNERALQGGVDRAQLAGRRGLATAHRLQQTSEVPVRRCGGSCGRTW